MNAKGNCNADASAESFFHALEVEVTSRACLLPREVMRHAVFEHIEVDYNRARRHSANGSLSPVLL